jgi:hypothetical protein
MFRSEIRLSALPLAAMLCVAVSTPAQAVELEYKWKKGDTHRFRYRAKTDFKVEVAGMAGLPGMGGGGGSGISGTVEAETSFALSVRKVGADGKAEVDVAIERVDFYEGGEKRGALDAIPPQARKLKAEIDKKGRARFYQMVTIYRTESAVLVGITKAEAGPTHARGAASDGEHEVEVFAAYDPKTGRVEARTSVKKAKKTKKTTAVEVKKDDPGVPALPKEILEMLVLPEGDLSPSGAVAVETPMGTIGYEMIEWRKDRVAVLRVKSKVGAKVEAPADDGDGDEDDDDDDGAAAGGMPDLGGMMGGLPGMAGGKGGKPGKPGKAGAGSAAMKFDVDVTTRFDQGKGLLLGVQGKMVSDVSAGGVAHIETTTNFKLERL